MDIGHRMKELRIQYGLTHYKSRRTVRSGTHCRTSGFIFRKRNHSAAVSHAKAFRLSGAVTGRIVAARTGLPACWKTGGNGDTGRCFDL